nr:ABC transporter permease [Lachnospiraceae bacterium]
MAGLVKKKQGSKVKRSLGDRIVDVIIYAGLALVALATVLPFLYILAGSFATNKELTEKAFFIIPEVWSLNAYQYAIKTANILRGLKNSILLTIAGTALCMM